MTVGLDTIIGALIVVLTVLGHARVNQRQFAELSKELGVLTGKVDGFIEEARQRMERIEQQSDRRSERNRHTY